jgi:Spy/CpxP family protein refolding chaperone
MKKTIAITAALLLIPAAVAFARVHGHGGLAAEPFAALNGTGHELTADQRQQIEGFRAAFVKETSEWKLTLREKKAELHAVLAARTPDREKALAKQREVSDLRAKLGEKSLIYRLDARSVLTPEQQALLPQHKGRGMHHRKMAGRSSAAENPPSP